MAECAFLHVMRPSALPVVSARALDSRDRARSPERRSDAARSSSTERSRERRERSPSRERARKRHYEAT